MSLITLSSSLSQNQPPHLGLAKTGKEASAEEFVLPTQSVLTKPEKPFKSLSESSFSSVLHQDKQLPHFGSAKRAVEASAKELISSCQSALSGIDPEFILDNLNEPGNICDLTADTICAWVKRQCITHHIPKSFVFKQLLREIKRYDLHQNHYYISGKQQVSTFALRNSLLLASQKSHVVLPSSEIFTKCVKMPAKMWDHLDSMESWIPEEQRVMGKWVETSFIKADRLAKEHPQQEVVLLKGGFGAGKTRLINSMYGEEIATGVIAPDKAKAVVRDYLPKMPHHIAHVQGSAVSYKFFNQTMMRPGTIVYDSALSDPRDLATYIRKAETAPTGLKKSVIVHDVARLDVLRALSVLKRPIFGEDPRIPPEFIIFGAVASKMSRVACMNHVLHATKGTDHEYHFSVGDDHGTDMREVLIIKDNVIWTPDSPILRAEAHKRLGLENLKIENGQLAMTATEAQINDGFRAELNGSVSAYVDVLQGTDRQTYAETFAGRTIPFKTLAPGATLTMDNLYASLDPRFTKHVSKSDFMGSLSKIDTGARDAFINRCNERLAQGRPISYLDLPLYTALDIHAKLQDDPWAG
jgi:hypothetical protein